MAKGFSLVPKEEEGDEEWINVSGRERKSLAVEMMKKVSLMAAPMVAVGVSQYLLQVVTVVMVGHMDQLSLSAVAIATSLTNVTGFSLLFGLAGALETLCGQAFGAEQYQKLGSYTYSSIVSLLFFCFPVSLLWVFMDRLLLLFHQDPLISQEACRYSIWLIPALFAYALLQSLSRYFQSQGLVFPLFLGSIISLCFHVPFCWVLVYKFRSGIIGAALSIGFSYWLNVALLCIFMKTSTLSHEIQFHSSSKEMFSSMKQFISLAVPSAMMACLEWWSFELLFLMSGFLPNSKLETSVLSICLTTSALHYFLVSAIGAAASTHVSNELGAGNPEAARAASKAAIFLGAIDAIIISITLYSFRHRWGYIYSSDREVAEYASHLTPILSLSIPVDSFLAVFSGIARGTGWQHIGAYANIGSYYVVGIPVGAFLCFVMKQRSKGLWIGILVGSTLQTLVLASVTFFTNWDYEAAKARDRMLEMTPQESHRLKDDKTDML